MFGIFSKSARHHQESAIGAAVLGGLLTVIAFPTLFINEGRSVRTARALDEGAASVISVAADQRDTTNDEKLIHISGEATTDEMLVDQAFGISAKAIRLQRTVEMYQWRENKRQVTHQINGKKTKKTEFEYDKVWSESVISSDSFQNPHGHTNPAEMPYASKTWEATNVTVGDFKLSADLIGQIATSEPLPVDVSSVPQPLSENLRVDGGTEANASGFYWAAKPDSENVEIGDLRIRFNLTPATNVSVIAQQGSSGLKSFPTQSGRKISMLALGNRSADEMFEQAKTENTAFTWMLRGLGCVMMVAGIGLVLRPLVSITQWIPVIGKLVGMGTALVAVVVGAAFSLLTISSAWLFYRPVIGVTLLVIGVGLLVFIVRISRSAKDPETPEELGLEVLDV